MHLTMASLPAANQSCVSPHEHRCNDNHAPCHRELPQHQTSKKSVGRLQNVKTKPIFMISSRFGVENRRRNGFGACAEVKTKPIFIITSQVGRGGPGEPWCANNQNEANLHRVFTICRPVIGAESGSRTRAIHRTKPMFSFPSQMVGWVDCWGRREPRRGATWHLEREGKHW